MALPNGDLLNIRIGGDLPSDKWSVGFWFLMTGSSGTPTPTQMNTAATSLLSGFNSVIWNPATNKWTTLVSSGCNLARATSYWYHDGTLVSAGSATVTPTTGSGTGVGANYQSRVISLLTDVPGRSTRGRIYMPHQGSAPTAATGLWTSISGQMANWPNLFNSTTGAMSAGYFFGGTWIGQWSVVSRTHGLATKITSLRCDNKPDTQHGRENKLNATVFDTATIV